jgi:hypothetical protein
VLYLYKMPRIKPVKKSNPYSSDRPKRMWVEIDEDDDYKHGMSKEAYNIKINNNNSGMFEILPSEYNDGELMIVHFINGHFDDIYSELNNYYIVGDDITVKIKYVSAEINGLKQQYTLSNFLTKFENIIADYGSVYYLVEKGVCGDDFVADNYENEKHIQMFKEMYNVFERVVDKGWFNIDMKVANMCKLKGEYKMIDFDSKFFIHTDPDISKKSYIDYMLFMIYLNLKLFDKIRIPIIISEDDFNSMIDNMHRFNVKYKLELLPNFGNLKEDVNREKISILSQLYKNYFDTWFKISNNDGEIFKPSSNTVEDFFSFGNFKVTRENTEISFSNYRNFLQNINATNIFNIITQILNSEYNGVTQEEIVNAGPDNTNINRYSAGQLRRSFAMILTRALLSELNEQKYLQIKSYIIETIKPQFNENNQQLLIDKFQNQFIDIMMGNDIQTPIFTIASYLKIFIPDNIDVNFLKQQIFLKIGGKNFSPIVFRQAFAQPHASAARQAFAQPQAFAARQAFAPRQAFAQPHASAARQAFAQPQAQAQAPGWSIFGFNLPNIFGGKKTKRNNKKRSKKNRSRRF